MVPVADFAGDPFQMLISFLGLTETCTVVTSTAVDDIWFGSSGSLLPMIQAKIMSADGVEITKYDTPGELLVKSPTVVLGYLNNEKATKETFEDGWMRTGDESVVRVSPKGNEHIFIVDRIKELIKVKVSNASTFFSQHGMLTTDRVCKSPLRSSKLIFSPILRSLIVPSSPSTMTMLENDPRPILSSRLQSGLKIMTAWLCATLPST